MDGGRLHFVSYKYFTEPVKFLIKNEVCHLDVKQVTISRQFVKVFWKRFDVRLSRRANTALDLLRSLYIGFLGGNE